MKSSELKLKVRVGNRGTRDLTISTQVRLLNEKEITTAIQNVRDDKNPTNWVLVGHEGGANGNPNALVLVAQGQDCYEGLKNAFSDDQVQYALCMSRGQYFRVSNSTNRRLI